MSAPALCPSAAPSFRVFCGDSLSELAKLPAESAHCCVTSPPYYGFRDYGHPDQIGLERNPDRYVDRRVAVFEQVQRVLRSDGTLWLNLGDCWVSKPCGAMKRKDMAGMPWRVALALRDAGWYLRSDVIWHKQSIQPENVQDRPTKAHEYLFLLSKSAEYYYDARAIAESSIGKPHLKRNCRSVWAINSAHEGSGHPAPFPVALAHRCISASTSEKGCCPVCGAAIKRIVKRAPNPAGISGHVGRRNSDTVGASSRVVTINRGVKAGHKATVFSKVIGTWWRAQCGDPASSAPTPCTVLDPFAGSSSTGVAALELGCQFIGVELIPEYCSLSIERLKGTVRS